jgi:mono/diheme cytochrome c family protein
MKKFLLGFIAAIVILPIGTLAYFRLGLAETRSDVHPPAWETRLMTSAVHASVRRMASGIHAPSPENLDDAIVAGGKLYFEGCAGCHGQPRKAEQDLSHYPPVPLLWQVGTKYSEPEIHWIIQHGIRHTAMSAYGPFYSDKQLWALASFVKRIENLPVGLLERIQAKTPPANSPK